MIVTLPWPDKGLSPNARLHWAPKAKLKAAARHDAKWLTVEVMQKHWVGSASFEGEGAIAIKVVFFPPDNRRRDDDNMVGSFKAYRDGIADALGVDDRRFRPHYFFEESAKPGRIEVGITRV